MANNTPPKLGGCRAKRGGVVRMGTTPSSLTSFAKPPLLT